MIKAILRRILPERLLIHAQASDHYLNGEKEIRLLPKICDNEKSSLDIGANIGIYTYFMRKYSSKVYAYEPNPVLYDRLRRLFPDVVVCHAAASDVPGTLTLHVPIENGRAQHELASVVQTFAPSTAVERHVVPSIRIDDQQLADVGFIKVDVERHEIPVLNGCLNTINRCRPIVMIEVAPLLYPRPLPEMFRFLTDLDYCGWFKFDEKYISLSSFLPAVHACRDTWGVRFMENNVIFVPSECRLPFRSLP